MSRQKGTRIGAIKCTACGKEVEARRTPSGTLYIHCAGKDGCGTDIRHGAGFQRYIREHVKLDAGVTLDPAPAAPAGKGGEGLDQGAPPAAASPPAKPNNRSAPPPARPAEPAGEGLGAKIDRAIDFILGD